MRLLSTLVSALALKSAVPCDVWTESAPPRSVVAPGIIFPPLSKGNFTSNDTFSHIEKASIYFQTGGDNAPFLNVSCPAPLIFESINSTYSACIATYMTAPDFTEVAKTIEAAISGDLVPGKSAAGFGDYKSAGNCPTLPLGNNGFVFYATRAFEKEPELALAS